MNMKKVFAFIGVNTLIFVLFFVIGFGLTKTIHKALNDTPAKNVEPNPETLEGIIKIEKTRKIVE